MLDKRMFLYKKHNDLRSVFTLLDYDKLYIETLITCLHLHLYITSYYMTIYNPICIIGKAGQVDIMVNYHPKNVQK